jgi:hypothetical protein
VRAACVGGLRDLASSAFTTAPRSRSVLRPISWDARIAVKLRGAGFLHEARAAMYRQRDVF